MLKNKNILFRADSSSTIGTGHIMRDLVLASRYKNAKIIFAVQDLVGNINHKITEAGYKVEILSSNDRKELDALIKKYSIELLVIDHYEIDYKYEKNLKKKHPLLTILSFDDTYEKHHCDILLNHNISADKKQYKGLLPKRCVLRCGSKYTLLRDEFYKERKRDYKKNKGFTLFLAMGGADHSNITQKILKTLEDFKHIKVHVLTTTANKHLTSLEKFTKKRDWIKLHINSNKVAKLMRKSDLAIITPSVILNEVHFMKLPFIAIQTAKNQEEIFHFLKEEGFSLLTHFSKKSLYEKLKEYIPQKIELINFTSLSKKDAAMVLAWRNHENVTKWMRTTHEISLKNHLQFIQSLKNQKKKCYFLVKQVLEPIGVIDFVQKEKKSFEIGLYANPYISGFGKILMQEILHYGFGNLRAKVLLITVVKSNSKAISLYEKYFFQTYKEDDTILYMELKR
jgi:UDP-2,4-diacetamido-2,4,6-trideoxy-beta-L-altropyranose hydrolase/UDP-4-amino-4,6-dideoxy-N-acetyl-beta-L-altrosamine N-acetyltransferase